MRYLTLSLLALCAAAGPALADIQYTTVLSTYQGGNFKPLNTTTIFQKKGWKREDITQKIGTFERTESTISNAALHQQILLDPGLKIYTVQPVDSLGNPAPQDEILPTGGRSEGVQPTANGKGKMVMTLGAQFVGNEKLLGREVRHYKTSFESDSSGCCGVGHTSMKSEVWMADITLPVWDEKAKPQSGTQFVSSSTSKCEIAFERKGNLAGYDAASKGLALKTIMFEADGTPSMSQQVTALSGAPLGNEPFAAPADFKKLSRAEYNQARLDALMASMKNMTGDTP